MDLRAVGQDPLLVQPLINRHTAVIHTDCEPERLTGIKSDGGNLIMTVDVLALLLCQSSMIN